MLRNIVKEHVRHQRQVRGPVPLHLHASYAYAPRTHRTRDPYYATRTPVALPASIRYPPPRAPAPAHDPHPRNATRTRPVLHPRRHSCPQEHQPTPLTKNSLEVPCVMLRDRIRFPFFAQKSVRDWPSPKGGHGGGLSSNGALPWTK